MRLRNIFCSIAILLAFSAIRAQAPLLSVPHGIYNESFRLAITSPVAGATIYYTDDGSDPREKGTLYDGPGTLKYRVFGDRAPRRFNSLVLRTFFGYSWQHWDNNQRGKAQYARDLWARETQAKMGDPISTGQYVHLFLNGLYWGIYNLCERVEGEYCENHFGGVADDLTSKNNRGCPTGFLNRLMKQGIFAHRFHELAQQALTHDGPLTPESAVATWDSLYHTIEMALWDESARWGDYRRDVHPYTTKGSLYKPDGTFLTERTRLLRLYFPVRTANFISQLRSRGWFPNTEAPAIYVDDVEIGYGLQPYFTESTLTMSGRNIYYTLDGSAPVSWFNNDAGVLSPTAKAYTDGDNVMEDAELRALPDTVTLRAICKENGEWSPIVTVRLAVDSPTGLSPVLSKREGNGLSYDLAGRRVTARNLRRGVFIVDGKKRIYR